MRHIKSVFLNCVFLQYEIITKIYLNNSYFSFTIFRKKSKIKMWLRQTWEFQVMKIIIYSSSENERSMVVEIFVKKQVLKKKMWLHDRRIYFLKITLKVVIIVTDFQLNVRFAEFINLYLGIYILYSHAD